MTEVEYLVLIQKINQFEKRLSVLEGEDKNSLLSGLYLEIELPEMDIDKLHFTRQYVKSLFLLKNGYYYAKDVLFHSARNTIDSNNRDILTEYLESDEVKKAFVSAYNKAAEKYNENADIRIIYNIDTDDIDVFLPSKDFANNNEVKTYNGGRESYWLKEKFIKTNFMYMSAMGFSCNNYAFYTIGVSPAFIIVNA